MTLDKPTPPLAKKTLILSQGPVPVPEQPIVEGGGLRCWGLAKGLKHNEPDIEVTVAYHESYSKLNPTQIFEGINVTTWSSDSLSQLLQEFHSVIVSYCMGNLSTMVVSNISPAQQLILDCYVPIYVEVSARESEDLEEEYHAFINDVGRWGSVLKRGDVFLCASDTQKRYYQGVLSALGRVNPATYDKENILIVPYGIYREKPTAKNKPITKLIGDHKYKKVLWFGGIYPWFDLRVLVDAICIVNATIPTKLVIVGAKNPYNTHPDFIRRYEELVAYINSDKKFQNTVVMQDWVKFEDRADWYLDSDCVVVINKEGPENELAWRTRLVDFIWADLPLITNGGDPLGEKLINSAAAFRFNNMDKKTIATDISKILASNELQLLHTNLSKLREAFYWDNVTKVLSEAVSAHRRASDLKEFGIFSVAGAPSIVSAGRLRRVMRKARKVPAYANKYGYRTTAGVVHELVRRKLASGTKTTRTKPAYVFVSHQLDMSGAPFIAIDMALEFKSSGHETEFYTYLPAHRINLAKLNKAGIKPRILMNKDMVPDFVTGDTVVFNTVAHAETVKERVFSAAEQGEIKQIIWYLHEDNPELLFRPDEQRRIKKLLEKNRLRILVPAQKIRSNYIKYFATKRNIMLLPYRHIVPRKYHRQLKAKDFDEKLTFVLPGTIGDGRKGQLPIFYAFAQFYKNYYQTNKDAYRNFELIFIGVDDDFLSRQIKAHATTLKGHFSYYGRVTWTEDLDIVSKGNMTICYSIREALPLFVFEGMANGHPVLRNDSSGMEEQLIPGKNGWYLDSHDYEQIINILEEVLNKNKTSSKKLAKMSARSNEIAQKQETNSYLAALSEDSKAAL